MFGQASDGGVFKVESGSSVTFSVTTNFERNSVPTPYSGGAVYAAGKVRSLYFRRTSITYTRIWYLVCDQLQQEKWL